MKKDAAVVSDDFNAINSTIIPPCYIAEGVTVKNSVIGPHVSIGENTTIESSVISKSIVQHHSVVRNVVSENSMIGSHTEYVAQKSELSLGDFSVFHQ